MPRRFKVAAVQMICASGEVEQNFQKAEALIRQAAEAGALLVVVPELFDSGYRVEEKDSALATTIPGSTTNRMTALCAALNIHLAASIIEKDGDGLYDTAVLVGPNGVVGTYRKTGLWDKENDRFLKGQGKYDAVYDIGICKVGMQICYEIGFPENARILALHGADILVCPSAFGKARYYAWDLASRSRALENGNYVIACNRAGTEKGETVFGAASRIVGPKGEVIAVAATEEDEVVVAEVDLDLIQVQREAIPYLKDLKRNVLAGYYRG
jgi:predicted amidohydrolase